MNRKQAILAAVSALVFAAVTTTLHAEESQQNLGKQVQKVLDASGMKNVESQINAVPVEGLSEVIVGGDVYYITDDGKHFIIGTVLDIDAGMVNLTEQTKAKLRLAALEKFTEDEMIIYGEPDLKHTITVFTDVNCPFCVRFHKKVEDYNDAGIRVRYLFLPVIKPTSFEDAVAVWCSEDRQQAMTDAKNGKQLPRGKCEHPLNKHLELGRGMGVNATPTVILSDGTVSKNYHQLTPKQFAAALDLREAAKAK